MTAALSITHLNSIMILLIPKELLLKQVEISKFKFHYDSINSTLNAPQLISLSIFKFHYDSINSWKKVDELGGEEK